MSQASEDSNKVNKIRREDNAKPLPEWTWLHGGKRGDEPRPIGNRRWVRPT
ncbi:MAG TPA: hypothetical protein VGL46_13165 [Pseudonocardiaceae bacterium]